MVRLLVRSRGGSDLHWLVVRFRGERPVPTGGRSLSKDPALLLWRGICSACQQFSTSLVMPKWDRHSMGSTGEGLPKKPAFSCSIGLIGVQDLRLFTQQEQGTAINGKTAGGCRWICAISELQSYPPVWTVVGRASLLKKEDQLRSVLLSPTQHTL